MRDFFRRFFETGEEINIINLSVSGHSSQEVAKRLNSEAEVRNNGEEMLSIIAVGTNDSYKKDDSRKTDEVTFTANMKNSIKQAKSHGKVKIEKENL